MKKYFSFLNSQLSTRGFTLIELLIVIAIIGVLAAGVITLINPLAQIQKANDAKRKNDLSQIQKALEAYYADHGKYPYMFPPLWRIMEPVSISYKIYNWGSNEWKYMSLLPKDPSSSRSYAYYSDNSTLQYYVLYAALERADDPQLCTGANHSCTFSFEHSIKCGTNIDCNYGVSSPNVSP